jgi:hypothetical protein
VLTLFVPGSVVQEVFPDAEFLHGRTLGAFTPMARIIGAHLAILLEDIATMDAEAADATIREAVGLILLAFGKQARLVGDARAASPPTSASSGCAAPPKTWPTFPTCSSPTSPTAWASGTRPISRGPSGAPMPCRRRISAS